jgi:uncharacterized membrane protein YfcA
METIGYAASLVMGLSLGMIGGGGSILTVPILVYLFAIHPVLATAYSLFIVGLTALVGGIGYLKKGEVDLKTGFLFAVPSFIGVYATRAFVLPRVPDQIVTLGSMTVTKPLLIMLVFAVLMVLASISMIRGRKPKTEAKELSAAAKVGLIGLEGLVVGTITGFVGAGGGFLIIPALVVLVGLPMKKAVGTSLFIIAAKSLIGFTGDLQHQPTIDWKLLLIISGIAVVGLVGGMLLSRKLSEAALKKGFGYFVLIMGCFVLGDQILKL